MYADSFAMVRDLRERLERGDFAGRGSIELDGIGVVSSVELAVKLMLNDVDHYDDLSPKRRRDPLIVARRRLLLEDLRRLSEQIG